MDYRVKDGTRRRVHKMYVGVVVHVTDEGRIDPLAVCWPDGRTFRIDEVLHRGQPGQMQKGAKTARFHIRFGRHETDLYLERRTGVPAMGMPDTDRWWVYAEDVTLEGERKENGIETKGEVMGMAFGDSIPLGKSADRDLIRLRAAR